MANTSVGKTEIEILREEIRYLRSLLARGEKTEEVLAATEKEVAAQKHQLATADLKQKQQERLFDTVLSSIVDFAYVFDKAGRFVYINQALLDLWQMKIEDAVGKNFFELNYPEDLAARLQQQIQTVFDTGQTLRDETPYTGAAGTTGYYEYIFVPVFDADGQVEVVAGSTRDITIRHQEQTEFKAVVQALEVERARLTSLFMQAPAFITVLRGPQHIFEMANPLYHQLVGLDRDIIGKPVREALPDVEGQGFFELLDEVYRTGKPFIGKDMCVVFSTKPGQAFVEHYVDFIYQPLTETDGSVSGIFVQGVDLTDRRRAQEALQASEARQSLLLRVMERQRETSDPDVMMTAASEAVGRHLGANRVGFFEMIDDTLNFGVSWTDGVLSPLSGTWLATDIGTNYLAEVRAGRTLGIADTEHDPLTANSIFLQIGARSIIGAPIIRGGRWHAGVYVHHSEVRHWTEEEIALVRDVADQTWDAVERARAEAALRESEEFHRFAAEAGRTGSWSLRLDTEECLLSPMMTELMGFPSGQKSATAAEWRARVHPDDRNGMQAALAAAIEHHVPFEFEFRIVLEDGSERWLYSRGGVVRTASGGDLRLHGASVDLTEKKRTQEALRESKESLALAINGAQLGTFYCKVPFDKIVWNDTCKDHFFLAHDAEVDFNLFYSLLHPEDREPTRQAIEQAMSEHAQYNVEYRVVAPDERMRWINAIGKGYYSETGEPIRFDGITIDITKNKIQERALKLLVEINDTTRALHEPQAIMGTVARLLGVHLGVSRCAYAPVEDDEDHFTIYEDYTNGCATSAGHYTLTAFGPRAVATLQAGHTFILNDREREATPEDNLAAFKFLDIQAIILTFRQNGNGS